MEREDPRPAGHARPGRGQPTLRAQLLAIELEQTFSRTLLKGGELAVRERLALAELVETLAGFHEQINRPAWCDLSAMAARLRRRTWTWTDEEPPPRPRVGGRRPAMPGELFPVGTPIHVGCGGEVVDGVCDLCGDRVPDVPDDAPAGNR